MAAPVSWSLKNVSLLVGCIIFCSIWLTSRHSANNVPEWTAGQPMRHKLDWDLPDTYHPPPPKPKPPKEPAIPWAEAKFKADAEAEAKRRKAEREKELAESPEVKKKAEELLKKVAIEQQRAVTEQAALAKENEGRLPFQADLTLDQPKFDVKQLRRFKPHNWKGPGHSTIATYLSTPNGSLQDPYFLSVLQQTYRLLWDPRTKSKYTFTVFVAPHITRQQRDILAAAGAMVRQLEPIESPAEPQYERMKFQFAKLHMWKEFDFPRILYLDADAFPMQPIDDLLDVPQLGCKRDDLPPEDAAVADILCQYSFNVSPQAFQPEEGKKEDLNVGVMVLQPNDSMHKRLLRNYKKSEMWDTKMADSGYFSHVFGREGPFPFGALERKWNGFFPQVEERSTLKIVHEKLWMPPTDGNDPAGWAKEDFKEKHREMVKFFEGRKFAEVRKGDGVKEFE